VNLIMFYLNDNDLILNKEQKKWIEELENNGCKVIL